MNKRWIRTRNFKDGNTDPTLNDYEYDDNDFRVKKIENLFCEESERSSMILDRNKGIESITYNYLNLPTKVTWSNTKYINYQYNAAGQKVSKTVRIDADSIKVVDYLDGFQYAGKVLQFFPTAEGYVRVNADKLQSLRTYNYVYNHTDHLGNVRLSYSKDPQTGTLEILDENHYYPFGLKHGVYAAGNLRNFKTANLGGIDIPVLEQVKKTEYQYKYQGQERQDELGLNWDSFKWRNYDYAIGRFMSHDPLSEKYAYNSPYAFQENKMGMGTELEGAELRLREGLNDLWNAGKKLIQENYFNIEREQKIQNNDTNASKQAKLERNEINSKATNELEEAAVETIKGGTQLVGSTAEDVGDGLTWTGYGLAPVGGLVIVPFGEAISTTGSTMNMAVDISDGNYKKAGTDFIINTISNGIGKRINKLADTGKLGNIKETETSKAILDASLEANTKAAESAVEKIRDEKK